VFVVGAAAVRLGKDHSPPPLKRAESRLGGDGPAVEADRLPGQP
jgi:hypothetical protein